MHHVTKLLVGSHYTCCVVSTLTDEVICPTYIHWVEPGPTSSCITLKSFLRQTSKSIRVSKYWIKDSAHHVHALECTAQSGK